MNYSKKFEEYWARVSVNVNGLSLFQRTVVKKVAFRAFQAGRRSATKVEVKKDAE